MGKKLTITVNGRRHGVQAAPDTPLLYVLRNDLDLSGPRFGCGLAQCGACTVHLNGAAIRSCITPISAIGAGKVTTLEGLGTPAKPHKVQKAFIEEQAAQCGVCQNGFIMTGAALLAKKPKATETEIRKELASLQCRCGTHMRYIRAIKRATEMN
jgi:nicotinate dehydrogenase subunit A